MKTIQAIDDSATTVANAPPSTARIEALEAQLREAREFGDALYRGVSAAVFVVDVCDDGAFRYSDLNRAHELATGMRSDAIRGKSPIDLVPEVRSAERTEAVMANYRRCVEARTSIEYEEQRTLCGRPTWWVTRLTPLGDATGRVVRLVGNAWDITTRKQLEADGDARQRRFRAVFELSLEAQLLADDDGCLVDVNGAAARLLGYDRQHLTAMHVWDILPEAARAEARRMWSDFLTHGRYSGETWLERRDGSLVQVEFEAVANVVPGMHLAVCRDLSARRAVETATNDARLKLEQAHSRLCGMIEALTHPVAAFSIDGRIVACNAAYVREFQRLYGLTIAAGDAVLDKIAHIPVSYTHLTLPTNREV